LLRIVDPDLESKTLDDFALAYIPIAPVEIGVVSLSPILIASGQHWLFTLVTLGVGLLIMAFFAATSLQRNKAIIHKGESS